MTNKEITSSSFNATRRLVSYSKKYHFRILLASFFSVLNKLFDIAPPLLIAAAVDIVVLRETSIFGRLLGITNLRHQLIVLSLITFIIWFCESLFQYLYAVLWRRLSQDIEHDLRMDTYRHIQNLDMAFFEDRKTGGLMSILNDDINQLERFLDIGANSLIQIGTTVLSILTLFFLISPQVAWLAMIPMPFIMIFSFKYQTKLEQRYKSVREQVGVLNSELSNNLSGIATIKAYTTEDYEETRIRKSSNEYRNRNYEAIKVSAAFTPIIRMIIVVGFTLMLIFGGFQTLDGSLGVAAYSAMIFLTQRLLWPLTRLGETFDQYQRAMASTNRIMDLLETPMYITSGNKRLPTEQVNGDIKFENVKFTYKDRFPVFEDLNVHIKPGQSVAFVGSTGVGKSTIVKLILRFYDPDSGRILLDDVDLRDLDIDDLRSAIGLVSQEAFLIDGSIRENIAYGDPSRDLKDIIAAAKTAEIHDFIMTLPKQYDTLVGERGQKLSGGQRQRIAIARAVLIDPPILILDEATSSVDNETEAAIQKSLEQIIVGRTTIIIAHRLSTVRNADRIYVIDDSGKITEQGTHSELVNTDGQYSLLWRVQTGEQLPLIQKKSKS